MRAKRGLAILGAVAALAPFTSLAACRGHGDAPLRQPVAFLASSPAAGAAFDAIRQAWMEGEAVPATLRPMLDAFIARYPHDGLVPFARTALALVAARQHDLATADRELALTDDLPPGSAHDLWTVTRAIRLRQRDDAEGSLNLLRPLVGKPVDPLVRSAFEEELTTAAMATHRDYEAISYMDAWLRSSSEEENAATAARVRSMVEQMSQEVLVGALQAMRAQRASLGYGFEIERILSDRLVRIARKNADAALARLLLDTNAGAIPITGSDGVALGELATSRRGLNVVHGRTLGLLLPTESSGLRDEAASVLRGVLWALGLPEGVRSRAAGDTEPSGPIEAAPSSCGALSAAPPLAEPQPIEGVRLVTRDDSGNTARVEVALDELAGEGAAIVIAGLDPLTAGRALQWADEHETAVIVLVPPLEAPAPTRAFGFVLGEPRDRIVRVLEQAAPALAHGITATVVDASEIPLGSGDGSAPDPRLGGLVTAPPVSCDIPAIHAGEPRFPIAQWRDEKTSTWLVSGSPRCAADAVAELSASRARGVVGLTLEAASMPPHIADLRVVSAQAGVIPSRGRNDPRERELGQFASSLGPLDWWSALGRDASTLARRALLGLPSEEATDLAEVTTRRVAARDLLDRARARLWTAETAGFEGERRSISRSVCAIEVPPR